MIAIVTMLLTGALFVLAFGSLLHLWRSMRRRNAAHLVLAIGFLVLYLGYSLGYLALFGELGSRWRQWRDFGTWTDDVAAVVPFVLAIAMLWRGRRERRAAAVANG